MNVLLLGNGGRESALAWKINQSNHCDTLHVIPGNAGTNKVFPSASIDILDFSAIESYCEKHEIEMIVVGPELPLIEGVVDYFSEKNILVFGPSKDAAQLEGSKAFAKEFMKKYDIPTAAMVKVNASNVDEGIQYIKQNPGPYVLKADGLAAGKGVIIENDPNIAIATLIEMLDGKFGDASKEVLIEEFLKGREFSVFAITDGANYQLLPIAKDYKKALEGDEGLNTGGMGAISPVSFVSADLLKKVEEEIVRPTVRGISSEGMDYKGVVFFGLIEVDNKAYVIEYNCRFGDPETEVILPRLNEDLLEMMMLTCKGELQSKELKFDQQYCTTVILCSGGYPESYEKGKRIDGIESAKDVLVFQAGTKLSEENILTNGGRVMALTALGENKESALSKSYQAADTINFEKKYYRKDIGYDVI